MIAIERQARKAKSIPLISLIDVVFQLLIYFMLTTSFTRSESLELLLPQHAGAPQTVTATTPKDADTLHIYITNAGELLLENQPMKEAALSTTLRDTFLAAPERGTLVLSADRVSVAQLVQVMDRIYSAGGKNIAVADWAAPPAAAPLRGPGDAPHG